MPHPESPIKAASGRSLFAIVKLDVDAAGAVQSVKISQASMVGGLNTFGLGMFEVTTTTLLDSSFAALPVMVRIALQNQVHKFK